MSLKFVFFIPENKRLWLIYSLVTLFFYAENLSATSSNGSDALGPTCDISVQLSNNPSERNLCEEGDYELCANVFSSSNNVEVEWLEDGDVISNDYCEEVYVDKETEFTFRATYTSEDNLIINGDFEDGDNDFDTDYDQLPGPCSPGFTLCDGYYAIWDATGQGHPAFDDCPDHSGSGYMMAINGIDGIPELWCQDVCLDPEASYILSGWGTSFHPDSPAQLLFTVDGDPVGNEVDLGTNLCSWSPFTGEFEADGENSVTICVYNENPDMQGNDFAIDDIEMYQVCTAEESMTVTISDLTITPGTSGPITCTQTEVEAFVDISPSQPWSAIEWFTANGLINNSNDRIKVDSAGTYDVFVIDQHGCPFASQVTVTEQIVLPIATIQGDTLIDCDRSELVLGSLTTTVNPLYEWTDSLGLLVGIDDTLIVMNEGRYILKVTDPLSGCSNVDTVIVAADTAVPSFSLTKSGDLTCFITAVELSTSVPQNFVTWTSNNGTVITDTDDRITVTDPGEYYAMSGSAGGCSHIDTIIVTLDSTFPAFDLMKSGDLTCNNTEVEITTTTPQPLVTWTTNNGTVITDTDDQVSVTEAGEYYAQTTSPGGCTHIDTIEINGIVPSFDYTKSPDVILNCDNPSEDVSITFDTNNYDFAWVGSASSLGTNSQVPITQAGTYIFQLTDSNGCAKLDSVMITEDFFIPQIFTNADLITCTQSNAQVGITWQDQVLYIDEVDWVLPDGNAFTAGTTTTTSQPGWVKFTAYVIANGCTIVDSILVEASNDFPTANITGDTLTCNTSLVTLVSQTSADVISVEWTLPDGTTDVNTDLQVADGGKYILEVTNSSGCKSSAEYNVVSDLAVPVIDLNPWSVITCIDTVATPDINITGAYSSVSWSGPTLSVDSLNLVASEAGDYEIEVTGRNGCISKDTLMVRVDTFPTGGWGLLFPTMSTSVLSCTQDTLETSLWMDQSEFREFEWTTPTGVMDGPIINITEPGTYILSVMSDNGCPAYDTLFIDQATDLPTFTSSASEITCTSDSITITANSASTNLTYDFIQISTGTILGSGDEITLELTEDIQLLATDENGCSAFQQIDFTYDTLTTDFTLAAEVLDCNMNSTQVELTSAAPLTQQTIYSDTGDLLGDESYEVTEPGNYTVTALADNGCPSSEIITIEIDTSTLDFELSVGLLDCNSPITPFNLIISEPFATAQRMHVINGGLEVIMDGEDFSPIQEEGIYEVIVTGPNGCTSYQEIEVIKDDSAFSFSLSADPLTCENTSTNIEITSSDSYTDGYAIDLVTMETYDDITNLMTAGTYEVHLTGSNGCESIETIEILANADIPQLDGVDVETTTCEGNGQVNAVNLSGGSPPYLISIDGGPLEEFTQVMQVSAGMHSLYVEDDSGCSFNASFEVEEIENLEGSTEPEITIIENTDRQLQVEVNKSANDIAVIQWRPMTDLSCYDCLDPQYLGVSTQAYEIFIQDIYGCEVLLETRVIAEEPSGVYIPNFVSISENNEDGGFTIFAKENSQVIIKEMNVYDRWGNLIFTNSDFEPNDRSQGWRGNYNNKSVLPGVYVFSAIVEYADGKTESFAGDLTVID